MTREAAIAAGAGLIAVARFAHAVDAGGPTSVGTRREHDKQTKDDTLHCDSVTDDISGHRTERARRRRHHVDITAAALVALTGCGVTKIDVAAPPRVAAEATAPDFTLTAHDGRRVALAEALSRGHVVLVFYRGHW